jgi:hypothetical protein
LIEVKKHSLSMQGCWRWIKTSSSRWLRVLGYRIEAACPSDRINDNGQDREDWMGNGDKEHPRARRIDRVQ